MSPRNPKPWPVKAPAPKKWAKCGAPGCKPGCDNCDGPEERARQAALLKKHPSTGADFKVNTGTTEWGEPDEGGAFIPTGEKFTPAITIASGLQTSVGRGLVARVITGTQGVANYQNFIDLVTKLAGERTFMVQDGIYKTSNIIDRRRFVSTVAGAQVVLLNTRGLKKLEFKNEIAALAEKICVGMRRAEVIVELQKDGVAYDTFGVVPD